MFARFNGEVIDRGDYLVVRTPTNPGYHWGNYLAFMAPPSLGEARHWIDLFHKEFADLNGIRHVALTWDSESLGKGIQEFLDQGYQLDCNKVLATGSAFEPAKCNRSVIVRTIESDADWEAAIQNQISINDVHEAKRFEAFKRTQMANYRRMSEARLGHWMGAFLGDLLVGDLGIFCQNGRARFQSVVTHPAYQRKGICGRLVYESARFAMDELAADTLVMVADENYHAARIYESVGFRPVGINFGLSWYK